MEDINIQSNSQSIQINLDARELKSLAGWATFRAIIEIIGGAMSCLGIITAAYGIPLIIAATKLLRASDDLRKYAATGDTQKISESFSNLNKYFRINGILMIICICLSFISAFILARLVGNAVTLINDYLNMSSSLLQ